MSEKSNARRRIQKPARLLKSLRLLRIRVERMSARAETPEEQRWCADLRDELDRLILAGDTVLPALNDPRDARRVRKRPVQEPLV